MVSDLLAGVYILVKLRNIRRVVKGLHWLGPDVSITPDLQFPQTSELSVVGGGAKSRGKPKCALSRRDLINRSP